MKRLFLILFLQLSILAFGQSKFSNAEIRAAAGNHYEYLIIGTSFGEMSVQTLLNKMGFYPDVKATKFISKQEFRNKWVHSNQTNGEVVIWEQYKRAGKRADYYITEFELSGDAQSIIKFYINFWTKALNFRDTKPGEVVSVRFLTDVATLSVKKDGTAVIKVEASKDRNE